MGVTRYDVPSDVAALYFCGVSDWSKGGGYAQNFHAPLVYAPGEEVVLPMFGGQVFRAADARLSPIPELPDGWQGLPRAFTTCRNFRFAVSVFGWRGPTDLRPRLTKKALGFPSKEAMTMRGSLRQRYEGSWSIILELGRTVDPATGKTKRVQKWISFRGSRRKAEKKLTELLGAVDGGTFVEPSRVTLIDWLRKWVEASAQTSDWRPSTVRVYKSVIETHVAASDIALVPLQRLRALDLERFLASLPLAAATLAVVHAVLHKACAKAAKDRLLTVSPAVDLERRRVSKDHAAIAKAHCWSATEARRFLDAAKTASPQTSAFMLLALDSGARRNELAGIGWHHVDFDAGTVVIERQLDAAGKKPTFGPTKTKGTRTVSLGPETITVLRSHKAAQAALKMRNRATYGDFGLVFAKEAEDLYTPDAALGQPITTLAGRRFKTLAKTADVRAIKFHGLRHTCATLLLAAGVPVHVVAQRLGHANATMTLSVYAHALPDMQQDAATRLRDVLHGG
jgi:integrase